MATGTEMMFTAAIKLILSHLKIDPETVQNDIARLRQIMADHENDMAGIKADLSAIKHKLKIHGEPENLPNGQAGSGDQGTGREVDGAGKQNGIGHQ